MTYAAAPDELTRAQRVAIALRKASRLEAEVYSGKTDTVTYKPVGFGAVLPDCDACPAKNWPLLGCRRAGRAFAAKKPHRIDWLGRKAPASADAAVGFCPNSYDDAALSHEALLVVELIDKEGLANYFGRAVQKLPARTVDFIGEVRGAWKRLLAERDHLERGD